MANTSVSSKKPIEKIITSKQKEINKFCLTNNITKLSLFGSYAKNTFTKKSDIDFLVEFKKGTKIGLLDIARMERELSEIFSLNIDLRTISELSHYFRDTVVKEAEVKYESGR
jgi:uncharacterized protein